MSAAVIEEDYVDLFAGPGGWDVAAKMLGLSGTGVEWDHAACETRRAFGLSTIEGDVTDHGPLGRLAARGLIASPPCQTFSTGGNGAGREALNTVLAFADLVAAGMDPAMLGWTGDPRTLLVLEPLRWALDAVREGKPFEWLAFEQVPPVLPIWERFATHLRSVGYHVATGVLNAEQYGVPQTRRRAVLVARMDGPVELPKPTHSHYYPRTPEKLDSGLLPWVSMATALGWGMADRPSFTLCALPNGKGTGAEWGGASVRESMRGRHGTPAWVYRASNQANAARRTLDQPAPTVLFGQRSNKVEWMTPEAAGETAASGIRVTVQEAAVLQSFPADYPWLGTKTKQYEQVGNAIPVILAAHVLAAALRVPFPVAA